MGAAGDVHCDARGPAERGPRVRAAPVAAATSAALLHALPDLALGYRRSSRPCTSSYLAVVEDAGRCTYTLQSYPE